jgi:hypothetical protein
MRPLVPSGPASSVTRALASGLASMLALASCSRAPAPSWPTATNAGWIALKAALDQARSARPRDPWAAGLRITMRDPTSGRVVDGRGAIAVAPGRAVRMMLVGAAGATLLDAWVTPTRWRIAVPPLDLVRRGASDEPRDMPVGFLRWWFLTPLTGTLIAAAVVDGGPLWVLREGGAVVELREGACERGCLEATRRASGRAETVEECRESTSPTAGDSARYLDEVSGLKVDLRLESVAAGPPSGEAFDDPDATPGPEPEKTGT